MEAMVFVSPSPVNRKEDPLKEYLRYLYRYTRSSRRTIREANREYLCREVAKEYGVTEKDFQKLEVIFDMETEGRHL